MENYLRWRRLTQLSARRTYLERWRLFTETSRGVDKPLWMVGTYVQDAPVDDKKVEEPSASHKAWQP